MGRFITILCFAFCCEVACGQTYNSEVRLTLPETIAIAQEQSIDGMMAKHTYLADYWQYRSYKAQLLPSLSLGATLPSFDRSLSPVQNAITGEYNYVENFLLQTDIGLTIQQNIAATGGNVQLYTGLRRMDQFEPRRIVDYNSSPISLIYNQPIGAFNKLRWDKKIEPQRYQKAKFTYLESVEDISNYVVELFFSQLTAQQELAIAHMNFINTDTLYRISKKRFEIGAITQNDLLQLELRKLTQEAAINSSKLTLDLAKSKLRSYLGYSDSTEIVLDIPDVNNHLQIAVEEAFILSLINTTVEYQNNIMLLEAQMDVARAKADRRPQIDLYARFGLNQVAGTIPGAYKNPTDQENVQLGIKVPIFDGGMAKGRVKMALSKQDVIEAQIEKNEIDRRQNIFLKVMQFNNQGTQCAISQKADSIARLRYNISLEQFALGRISVLDFNTAQSERSQAQQTYIGELKNFWSYYFTIQRLTLYDFMRGINISSTFDKAMLEK